MDSKIGLLLAQLLFILAVASLFLPGCVVPASSFLGNTTASVSPITGFNYTSSKNQEGLDASGEMNKDGTLKFSIKTTAITPEAAIAAAQQATAKAQENFAKLLDILGPLIQQGIVAGTKGAIK